MKPGTVLSSSRTSGSRAWRASNNSCTPLPLYWRIVTCMVSSFGRMSHTGCAPTRGCDATSGAATPGRFSTRPASLRPEIPRGHEDARELAVLGPGSGSDDLDRYAEGLH